MSELPPPESQVKMTSTAFELRTTSGELRGSFEIKVLEDLVLVPVGGSLAFFLPSDKIEIPSDGNYTAQIAELEEREQKKVSDSPLEPKQDNYRTGVLDIHKILDELNVPANANEVCTDPDCDSPVGHRLRKLRDVYILQKNLLDEVRRIVKQGKGLVPIELTNLLEGNRTH